MNSARKERFKGCALTYYEGSNRNRGGKSRKPITALLACSASGKRAPQIFTVSGEHFTQSWSEPLTDEQCKYDISFQWLTVGNWFPKDADSLMRENGSMEKRLIKTVIQHIRAYVRKFLSDPKTYCLILDGHQSRERLD